MNPARDPEVLQKLKEEDLRYVSDQSPGFFRQKIGKKFEYYNLEGKKIGDKEILKRIESLVIPPAWKNVWICPKENGHLQATGKDDRGRKQYIYHPDWVKLSQLDKFSKMIDFGLNLPKIRQKINYDLQRQTMDKEKILATVIWLLEHTFIRIGNEEYSKENNSFGLTTLRNRHVKIKGLQATFQFRGKSGVMNTIAISNPKVVKTIKKCIELPGYELFQFIDDSGERRVIDSADVNKFLKDLTKDDFSAKDFRTWGATNLSATYFYQLGPFQNLKHLKKNIGETVKKVASHLNNTVSVCRSYYIHPTVIKSYETKTLIPHFKFYSKSKPQLPGLAHGEFALIKLLQKYS
ncbi:DNA topoisomerase IB [Candidatus Daviesbacteria bacterium]|nr:DNA topoisomerase IB [Candidatus Daviesbacteria bacterium]